MTHLLDLNLNEVAFSYEGDSDHSLHFSAQLKAGRLVAIMGPSGAGKSTLFSLICGFEYPQSGSIHVGPTNITALPPAERPVSMVFQENNLFAHLTVADNVALGIAPSLKLTAQQSDRRDQAIAATGLEGLGKRLPSELSGGQRQRVALARILLRDRPILLLDEAFASLGPALRAEMLDLVRQLHDKQHMTTLMITHAPEDAQRIADDLLFLADGKTHALMPVADALHPDQPDPVLRDYLKSEV